MREHLPRSCVDDPRLPLVVLSYHPGIAAGSYEDRDYFELLTPLLFDLCQGSCRLRVFTVNHPGYDMPEGCKVDRHDLEPFSIDNQPAVIDRVLRWLLRHRFADEQLLYFLPFGHSMGGLALAQTNLRRLQADGKRSGQRLRVQKVLSAPALVLHENVRGLMRQLRALAVTKRAFGRVPGYDSVTGGLFRGLAPLIYRLRAASYALDPGSSFVDFARYDPYVLLEQGLQLLQLAFTEDRLAALLKGSHLIVCNKDGMVDSAALLQAAGRANGRAGGSAVTVHALDSSHNAERDDPQLVAGALGKILFSLVGGDPAAADSVCAAGDPCYAIM